MLEQKTKTMKIKEQPALLLVDIQKGLDDIEYYGGHRNNMEAESNARRVLDFWRANDLPIFHIKHNSTNPNSRLVKGKPGNDIKDIVQPMENEPVIEKNVNSAFIGTDLQERLDQQGITKLVIVGLTTDHCISTTTRMAGNLGYETYLIADATATFDKIGWDGKRYAAELVHAIELASLHEEFAIILNTEDLIRQLED
jgi:nicotinamidase-related amidase